MQIECGEVLPPSRLVITMRSMYGFATLLLMAIAVSGANSETGKRQWFVRANWERALSSLLGIDCESHCHYVTCLCDRQYVYTCNARFVPCAAFGNILSRPSGDLAASKAAKRKANEEVNIFRF